MKYHPLLIKVKLIKRYKRFLADVTHPEMGDITVYCPNTGSMKNCWQPDWNAWLQLSDNKKRKYPYTWVLTENTVGDLIGINSALANELVVEGLKANKIDEISDVDVIQTEVKYGKEKSRIDILVHHVNTSKTYIEVKSVTLLNDNGDGRGMFPDAITTRGQKHIRELMDCIEQGHQAILFFMVQHSGINSVEIAFDIDPIYADLITQAIKKGVKVLAYKGKISSKGIVLDKPLPFRLK